MQFIQYFQSLWFNQKESQIYLTLYKLWTKPASTIAKKLDMERTYVYKILLKMCKDNIVSQTLIWWVKHFFIPNILSLKTFVKQKISKFNKLENDFDIIQNELLQYDNLRYSNIPKISIFDWDEWINNLYNDIIQYLKNSKYISIKLFASNTYETQTSLDSEFKNYSQNFFENLEKLNVWIDTYLWQWISLMEHISKSTNIENLLNLPASNSAINIYVVWKTVYFIIFKEIPFWIKIDSEDMAYTFHFLFDNLNIQ